MLGSLGEPLLQWLAVMLTAVGGYKISCLHEVCYYRKRHFKVFFILQFSHIQNVDSTLFLFFSP